MYLSKSTMISLLGNYLAATLLQGAASAPDFEQPLSSLEARVVFNFASEISGSNLAPRSNGKVLATTQSAPKLLEIDPSQEQTAELITTFVGEANTFGIVEVEPDVFYVGTANYTLAPQWQGIPGSNAIYRVNMTDDNNAIVTKVVEIAQAFTCDGLAVVNTDEGLIITGDTQSGELYLIDVKSNSFEPIYQSTELNETAADASELAHVGINGLKFYEGSLYYTVTSRGTFGRLTVDEETGSITGPPQTLLSLPLPDDLEVDNGNAILTQLETGLIQVGVASQDGKGTAPQTIVDLRGANAVSWSNKGASEPCLLFALFNRKIINETGSGLAVIDATGSGLRSGC